MSEYISLSIHLIVNLTCYQLQPFILSASMWLLHMLDVCLISSLSSMFSGFKRHLEFYLNILKNVILNVNLIYSCAEFSASLLKSSVSHATSEVMLICCSVVINYYWCSVNNGSLIIISVEEKTKTLKYGTTTL